MAILEGALGIYSDDFAGSEWNAAQPPTSSVGWAFTANGGTLGYEGYGTTNARSTIQIASGTNRAAWGSAAGWNVPFLRQATTASTANFSITLKLDAIPNFTGTAYREMGMLVWTANGLVSPGVTLQYESGPLWTAFGGNFGGSTGVASSPLGYNSTIWLRLSRTSTSAWSYYVSTTGTFDAPFTTSSGLGAENLNYVGLYLGLDAAAASYTAKYDYFFEDSAPITSEDAVGGPTSSIMVIT